MAIFDNKSNIYDDWYKTKLGKHVDLVESECAFNLFKIKKGMKILDIGCGTGNFSIKLAKKGCKVSGIDLSDKMLILAREKAEKENVPISYYNMSVYDLNFPDQHFDAVFSMATFGFNIKEEEISMQKEEELSKIERPGFFCVLWIK
jgi:ubiquinone/menaquinone biosynthesis C-methylase UbiE